MEQHFVICLKPRVDLVYSQHHRVKNINVSKITDLSPSLPHSQILSKTTRIYTHSHTLTPTKTHTHTHTHTYRNSLSFSLSLYSLPLAQTQTWQGCKKRDY